ncbi:MAG: hypothetical protein ACAH12_05340 [Methylophilaceae bacterium]
MNLKNAASFGFSRINIVTVLIGMSMVFLSFVFGLLAVTANPMLIGLAVGLVGGVFLLMVPKWNIWLVFALGLGTGALIAMAGPAFSKLSWAIAMLALLLWIPAILNLLKKQEIPFFIWLVLIFVIYSVLISLFQFYSIGEFSAGFKRYFQTFGLLIAMVTLAITRDDFDRWKRLIFFIAMFQLPFALYELLVLVPLRGGLEAGGEATDIVAGTIDANLVGGSANSTMVVFLIIVYSFVFIRWLAGYMTKTQLVIFWIFMMIPLLLGESKIVVILIPLAGLTMMRREIVKAPVRYLPVLIGFALMTMLTGYVYVFYIMDSTVSDVMRDTLSYNVESVGYGTLLLNRTTVISFWWSMQGLHDPLGFFFGHGLGSSYFSSGNNVTGHIAAHYPMYGINLTTLSTLLWDTGVIGTGLFVSIFISAWRSANWLWRTTKDNLQKADSLAIQAALAIFILFIIYNDSMVNLFSFELIMTFILGYLGFMVKEKKAEIKASEPVTRYA